MAKLVMAQFIFLFWLSMPPSGRKWSVYEGIESIQQGPFRHLCYVPDSRER